MCDRRHPAETGSDEHHGRRARKALAEITEPTAKAEVQKVHDVLPDAFTMEDLVEWLDEREHIRQGLWSALNEPLVSQEEMEGLA